MEGPEREAEGSLRGQGRRRQETVRRGEGCLHCGKSRSGLHSSQSQLTSASRATPTTMRTRTRISSKSSKPCRRSHQHLTRTPARSNLPTLLFFFLAEAYQQRCYLRRPQQQASILPLATVDDAVAASSSGHDTTHGEMGETETPGSGVTAISGPGFFCSSPSFLLLPCFSFCCDDEMCPSVSCMLCLLDVGGFDEDGNGSDGCWLRAWRVGSV